MIYVNKKATDGMHLFRQTSSYKNKSLHPTAMQKNIVFTKSR